MIDPTGLTNDARVSFVIELAINATPTSGAACEKQAS